MISDEDVKKMEIQGKPVINEIKVFLEFFLKNVDILFFLIKK